MGRRPVRGGWTQAHAALLPYSTCPSILCRQNTALSCPTATITRSPYTPFPQRSCLAQRLLRMPVP